MSLLPRAHADTDAALTREAAAAAKLRASRVHELVAADAAAHGAERAAELVAAAEEAVADVLEVVAAAEAAEPRAAAGAEPVEPLLEPGAAGADLVRLVLVPVLVRSLGAVISVVLVSLASVWRLL